MLDETWLNAHASAFEDFWHRRVPPDTHELTYPAFGYQVHLRANDPAVLNAARVSAARYCLAQPLPNAPTIQINAIAPAGKANAKSTLACRNPAHGLTCRFPFFAPFDLMSPVAARMVSCRFCHVSSFSGAPPVFRACF